LWEEAANELHVLTHIERTTLELLAFQRGEEGFDEARPSLPVHGACPDVDFRVLHDALTGFVGAAATVVVAVDVQHEHAVPALYQPVQQADNFGIEAIVLDQGTLDYAFRRTRAP